MTQRTFYAPNCTRQGGALDFFSGPRTMLAGSPLRTIERDRRALREAGHMKRRPMPHELAQQRLEQQFEERRGDLYEVLASHGERSRSLRSDGAGNLRSLLSAVLDYVEPNGAIGRRSEGGRFRFLTLAELGFRAFGRDRVQNELDAEARAQRWFAYLQSAGLVTLTSWRKISGGDIRSVCAIKRVSARLLELLGVRKAFQAFADQKARAAGMERAGMLGRLLKHTPKRTPPRAAPASQSSARAAVGASEPPTPPPPKDDGRRGFEAARAALAFLK